MIWSLRNAKLSTVNLQFLPGTYIYGSSIDRIVHVGEIFKRHARKKPEHDSNGTSRIGLCVSGQTTCQLSLRFKTYPYLDGQIIMMIGVNDFKKGPRISTIKNRLISIIRFLEKKGVVMVLLTLPPIPILRGEREEEIFDYYRFILRLGERPTVRAVNIHHLFKNPNGTNNLDLFERYFGNPLKKRIDLVHWNTRGIHKVEEVLRHYPSV